MVQLVLIVVLVASFLLGCGTIRWATSPARIRAWRGTPIARRSHIDRGEHVW